MIVRTIGPFVSTPGPEATRYTGTGDIQEQIYLTPSKGGSFTWGAGPALSMPTATTAAMQTGSWAAGPTFVALVMPGPWVVGAVVNNVWTFADSGSATKVTQFLLQPAALAVWMPLPRPHRDSAHGGHTKRNESHVWLSYKPEGRRIEPGPSRGRWQTPGH